jgi:hypothetical protein
MCHGHGHFVVVVLMLCMMEFLGWWGRSSPFDFTCRLSHANLEPWNLGSQTTTLTAWNSVSYRKDSEIVIPKDFKSVQE